MPEKIPLVEHRGTFVEQPLDIIAGKPVMLVTEMTINGHQTGFIKDAVELFFSEGKQCLRDTLF
tara:strand:+ start:390 stop:581 length:192 start_codon:yes stop_codon:yes gene_type:complete